MANPELPPGVKPHDSDPAERKRLGGSFAVTATVRLSCRIHAIRTQANGWRQDDCYLPSDMEELTEKTLKRAICANSRLTLDELDLQVEHFEPD